ncbi:MAG TPA: PD-(D/E)XK nuclease family protein [Paludibacteraceae bacterium]|nr:PD-(D/E)XK nuclease family protein [Paludibacteraceae bacterium]
MESFLYRIAQTYYNHYEDKISDFTFVFPNRRAGMFFQRYISQIAKKPLFSPEILTINDCFTSVAQFHLADRLSLLFRLYRIYKEKSGTNENFDSFAYWGEMLLNDFDDIDKYRIDARQLFTNVTELKQIDRMFNYLSENQLDAIRQFWKNFIPIPKEKTQEDFIQIWKILYPVYQDFTEELKRENMATEGMIYRNVAERLESEEKIQEWEGKQFVFIGFNALNRCEKTLFEVLQKKEKADFYWDYEAPALRDADNPASTFFMENTKTFPSKFSIETPVEERKKQYFELIAVPSEIGQIKQIYEILNRIYPQDASVQQESWIKTAVVLPNENLLLPALYSLPEHIEKVNVTMGFPLKSTPVSGLIEHVFDLQKRIRNSDEEVLFYHQPVTEILQHSYITLLCGDDSKNILQQMVENNSIYIRPEQLQINELFTAIFRPQNDAREMLTYLLNILRILRKNFQQIGFGNHQYRMETDFVIQYYRFLNRMSDILQYQSEGIEMKMDTLMRLIFQYSAFITLPFVGEPLEGLQIMGVLETRGLDFDNILLTSFNEGVFPKNAPTHSFIPYNLRRGFGLPAKEHQDAISAYNFYRLIHHAQKVYFLYNSSTEGFQTGEVSRFLYQLEYLYDTKVERKNITYDIFLKDAVSASVEKDSLIREKLQRFVSSGDDKLYLSASSINAYIDCPLKFYYAQIARIKETEEITETVENDLFGTLFHSSAELLYKPLKDVQLGKEDFEKILRQPSLVDEAISLAFSKHFFKNEQNGKIPPLEGNNLLISKILKKFLMRLLYVDQQLTPFRYLGAEEFCSIRFPLETLNLRVNIKGYIDRIDETENFLRIIDYKTGTGNTTFKLLDDLFDGSLPMKNRPKHIFQVFMYCLLYRSKAEKKIISPAIYYLKEIFSSGFSSSIQFKPEKHTIQVEDFGIFEHEFKEKLTLLLNEIFNPEIPFKQTQIKENCDNCSFMEICNR